MALWQAVVTLAHSALGGTGTNTWHIRTNTSQFVEKSQSNGAMDAIRVFYTAVQSIYPDTLVVHFDGAIAGVGGNDTGDFTQIDPWTVVGTTAGGVLPPSQCLCVTWSGQTGDKSRNGRTFLGPLVPAVLEANGTPDEPKLAIVRNAAAALVTESMEANEWAVGVFSRQEDVFRDFTGSKVRNQFASLRSRRD